MSTHKRRQLIMAGILGGILLFLAARLYAANSGGVGLSGMDGEAVASPVFIPMVTNGWPATVQLTQIAEASNATDLANAGDERLFIVEQPGRIHVYDGSEVLPTPFLNIVDRVDDGGFEMGLLGLAFHPDYADNGYFFVNYTTSAEDGRQTRISRFSVDAENPNLADAGSEEVVLAFDQPYINHNGGALHFGPDGYLYIAVGDGGSSNDPDEVSQDSGSILGKLLRIDVDGNGGDPPDCDLSGNGNYQIPAGNPLADGPGGACDEIWALGLRNPWRFSFDAETDDMWIADVGQGAWEEVDFQAAGSGGGQNYGWDCYEGDHANANDPSPACTGDRANYVFPIHEYGHDNGRCSITGGYVYRGSRHPALQGHYFFADFCSGELWSLSGAPLSPTLTAFTTAGATLSRPSTFGQDVNGELYVAGDSAVYRLDEPGGGK